MKAFCPKHQVAYDVDEGCLDCLPEEENEIPSEGLSDEVLAEFERFCSTVDVAPILYEWVQRAFAPDDFDLDGDP